MHLSQHDVHGQFAKYFSNNITVQVYLYYLSCSMEQGHICVPINVTLPLDILDVYQLTTTPKFERDLDIMGTPSDMLFPFILDDNVLYTQRNFKYEIQFANSLKEKLATPQFFDISLFPLAQYFPNTPKQNSIDWQFISAINALLHQVAIITGGPGTGKTTTVSKILALLLSTNPNTKIALAAPTGKAAARLSESMNSAMQQIDDEDVKQKFKLIRTYTIHRLLGTQKDSIYFKHNKTNLLDYDVIVVDECSMIDLALFSKLLEAVPPNCKLILLGDKNQLAAVEAGSIFGDLCTLFVPKNNFSNQFIAQVEKINAHQAQLLQPHFANSDSNLLDKVVTLEHSYRFNDLDGIGVLSKAIITNDESELSNFISFGQNNQVQLDETFSDIVFNEFIQKFKYYIQDEHGGNRSIIDALKCFNHCAVLGATRSGSNGIYNLNVKIEQYLIQKGIITATSKRYNYKPIMVTENNYQHQVFNGDIGLMFQDGTDGVFKAYFLTRNEHGEEIVKSVLPSYLPSFETCYAMTIHKSQGSEFDHVLILLPSTEANLMLNRELVYTAITRAKKSVVLQTTAQVLLQACSQKMERNSGLQIRLK